MKIRALEQKNNKIVKQSIKKIELKKIEIFLNNLMQLISILKKIV
jgi:hypothetical protein